MKVKYYILLILFSSLLCNVYAQRQSTFVAIGIFTNTPFFDEFQQSRERAEETVKQFKELAERKGFSEDTINRISGIYNTCAETFNKALYNIKNDMLHKQKRSYIINFPVSYSKQVERDLLAAQKTYQETFVAAVNEITEGEITGSALLTLLPQLIDVCNTAFKVLNTIKSEIRRFNADLLETTLIQPYRFRYWDEIY